MANTADASTPALLGAGVQSHLHALVLQKEAKISAAFKNGVAEELFLGKGGTVLTQTLSLKPETVKP